MGFELRFRTNEPVAPSSVRELTGHCFVLIWKLRQRLIFGRPCNSEYPWGSIGLPSYCVPLRVSASIPENAGGRKENRNVSDPFS